MDIEIATFILGAVITALAYELDKRREANRQKDTRRKRRTKA